MSRSVARTRLSTVEKGRKFIHRGKTYTMLSSGPRKDKVTKSTFRWVESESSGKKIPFRVNGATQVTLLADGEPSRRAEGRGSAPAPTRSTLRVRPRGRAAQPATVAQNGSVGGNVYRVKAKWWSKKTNGYVTKEFRVEANTAAAAIQEVESSRKSKNSRVNYTVARVSE